jgi:hypothetical protein
MLFTGSMLDEALIAVAALLIAVAVIYRFSRTAYKGIQRIEIVLGVDKDGRTIADRLDSVEHQLFPNGGSSLSDKIVRIEFVQREMKIELDEIKTISNTWLRQEGT